MARTKVERWTVDQAKGYRYVDEAGLRKLYTAYRDIAQKRIARLSDEFSFTQAYKQHEKGFAKLKDISSHDLPKAFADLSRFLTAKASTVTGQKIIREKIIKKLRGHGLDVTLENYEHVMTIFDEMRSQKLIYGSDKVVPVADSMLHTDDTGKNQLLDHLDELLRKAKKLETAEFKDDKTYTSEEILSMLD